MKKCSRSDGGERDYAGLNVSRALGLPGPQAVPFENQLKAVRPYTVFDLQIMRDTMGTISETEMNNEIARLKKLAEGVKEDPGKALELSREDYGKVGQFLLDEKLHDLAATQVERFYLRHSYPTHDHAAEAIARQFHEAYEELAPQMGWQTQQRSRKPWAEVPEENRKLMIATVKKVFGL